jgi:hypothetical protein
MNTEEGGPVSALSFTAETFIVAPPRSIKMPVPVSGVLLRKTPKIKMRKHFYSAAPQMKEE